MIQLAAALQQASPGSKREWDPRLSSRMDSPYLQEFSYIEDIRRLYQGRLYTPLFQSLAYDNSTLTFLKQFSLVDLEQDSLYIVRKGSFLVMCHEVDNQRKLAVLEPLGTFTTLGQHYDRPLKLVGTESQNEVVCIDLVRLREIGLALLTKQKFEIKSLFRVLYPDVFQHVYKEVDSYELVPIEQGKILGGDKLSGRYFFMLAGELTLKGPSRDEMHNLVPPNSFGVESNEMAADSILAKRDSLLLAASLEELRSNYLVKKLIEGQARFIKKQVSLTRRRKKKLVRRPRKEKLELDGDLGMPLPRDKQRYFQFRLSQLKPVVHVRRSNCSLDISSSVISRLKQLDFCERQEQSQDVSRWQVNNAMRQTFRSKRSEQDRPQSRSFMFQNGLRTISKQFSQLRRPYFITQSGRAQDLIE